MAFLAQKLISASGATEATEDPDFPLVTGLYHFDGSNGAQNNTFTGVGASGASQSWTRNGSPTQGSFSPFSTEEGKWGVQFDGSDDYLALPNHSDFTFGSGNWTVEAFVNVNVIDTNYRCIYSASYGVQFYVYNNQLHLAINDTDNISGYMISANSTAGQIPYAGVWHHVAAYRDGSNFYCSVDGVVSSMGSSSATIATPSAQAPSIGIWGNTSLPMDGYISNLRVIKGTALYGASNFIAPSSPLTDVTNTKLLTCCSNRFRDKSTSAHTITPSSVPKIRPFSPFAPSAEYDASTMGGSGHFVRTTSDSISFSDSSMALGNGDFTIEGWFYFDGDFSAGVGLFQQENGLNGPALGWWPGGSNGWQFYYGSGTWNHATGATARMFEWTHIAYVRSSGVVNLYVNGVKATSDISDSTNYASTNFVIGYFYSSTYAMEGYISNFKVSLNAIYTSAFTPPTALVTPTSGGSSAASTKILVDFTNAGIIDSSRKTNALTVNNAQLDTSVKKFGTASAEFDGTSDSLKLVNVVPLGTSPFTVEFFFRSNTTSLDTYYRRMYKMATVTGQDNAWCEICINSSSGSYGSGNNIFMYTPGNTITGTATPFDNNWHHFALTRDTSNNLKMFVDGTQDGSTVTGFTNDLTQTEHLVGANDTSGNGDFLGYIDELRLTRKARYTANFTAPTKAFLNL